MADVIGPNSYLPGQLLKVPEGTICDEHPDRFATKRIVGESDSFGSELCDMCDECYQNYLNYKNDSELNTIEHNQPCDICHNVSDKLIPTRDPEEGSCGRIYYACQSCHVTLRSNY